MSLSNYGSDKVSSATQMRVTVVTHKGGYARNWPLLPGHSGRAESWGQRERLRASPAPGEKKRTARQLLLLLGKATSSKHPNFSIKVLEQEVAFPRSGMYQAGSRARSLPAPKQLCLELQPAVVQCNIQTRCMSLPRNTSCPWCFFSPTETEPALDAGESPSLHLPTPTQDV